MALPLTNNDEPIITPGFDDLTNYVGMLQELCVKNNHPLPTYSNVQIIGPHHKPTLKMSCKLGDISIEREMKNTRTPNLKRYLAFEVLNSFKKKLEETLEENPAQTNLGHVYNEILQDDFPPRMPAALVDINCHPMELEFVNVTSIIPANGDNPMSVVEEKSQQQSNDDAFKGFLPYVDYPTQLNFLCQKQGMELSFQVLSKEGLTHNLTTTIKAEILKQKIPIFSKELKMNTSAKNIKKHLAFLLLKVFQERYLDNTNTNDSCTNTADITETDKKEEMPMEFTKGPVLCDDKDCAKLKSHEHHHLNTIFKDKRSKDLIRNPPRNLRAYKQLQNIISIEKRAAGGKVSINYHTLINEGPFVIITEINMGEIREDRSFSFFGSGETKDEAMDDSAKNALEFFDEHCLEIKM